MFLGAWDAFIRDRCKCVYCGYEGTTFETWLALVSDHLIPVKAGGGNSRCGPCSCLRPV